MLHYEFLYDKAWIPTIAIHVIEARKTSTYMLLAFALSFVKLCWPLWEVCHALKIKITYTPPYMHYSYTRGRHKNMPSRSTQKCSTPTLGVNNKNMIDWFLIHQINAPSSCCYLSKVLLQKRDMGYAKVIHKKRKKKKKRRVEKKWTSVRNI